MDEQTKALSASLRSDPMIGPDLPKWMCDAIARKVIGWGYTRPTSPGGHGE